MNDDGGRCELPSPVLPGELSHLTQEPELQEAWGHCAAMRRAEAAAIEALHAYRVRRLAEASGEHAFRRRAVEKAVLNEAGAVLGLTSSEVRRYLDCADFVQDKLPQTWRAFRSGATDIKRVRRIAQAAEGIAHRRDLMPVFDAEAAEKASAMNIHEIDRWAKRRVPELDAEAHRTRCERARQNRFVAFTHRDDGMTKIDALLPTVSVVAVERQLQQEALRAVRRGGGSPSSRTDSDTPHDEQKLTLVQAMADAFAARVAGIPEPSASGAGAANSASARGRVTEPAHPGASENQGADQLPLESSEAPEPADTAAPQPPISARIGILVPAETLTGEGETPAVSEDGSFVLPAAEARRIANDPAAEHEWYAASAQDGPDGEQTVTAVVPLTSAQVRQMLQGTAKLPAAQNLLNRSSAARFAGGKLKEAVVLRDGTCQAYGCTRPAHSAEIDHRIPHERGGKTAAENLQALCKEHHDIKSHGLLPQTKRAGARQTSRAGPPRTDPVTSPLAGADPG